MIKKVYLIGMGPGDKKYLTLEAVELIKRLNLFLIPGKTGRKKELSEIRRDILRAVRGEQGYRILELEFPERKKSPKYKESVREWRLKKLEVLKQVVLREDEEEAGFLIWGDPSIYDGHMFIFNELSKELGIEFKVVPGISAFQVLSSAHRVALTDVAESLIFTTPRGIKKALEDYHSVVVFLDNYESYKRLEEDVTIYWGAYLGTEKQVVLSGRLRDVVEEITNLRRELRKKFGWIMELYFLKKEAKD